MNFEQIVIDLLGEPNKRLSRGTDWRYGRKGALSVDVEKGVYFNHETGENGGIKAMMRAHGLQDTYMESAIEKRPNTPEPAPKTAEYAKKIWNSSQEAHVNSHPYALKKGITKTAGARRGSAYGRLVGKPADCIVVPARSVNGELTAVQCINSDGDKQSFGRIRDSFLLIGDAKNKSLPWYVCEGWASAVSMVYHHHKGHAVCAVSFGKNQLGNVAKIIADHYQPDEITIISEVDS